MRTPHRSVAAGLAAVALLMLAGAGRAAGPAPSGNPTYRTWVEEMKASPKGPFIRIKWFCNDGTIQPPKAFACANHGGGIQHGQWSDRVVKMRKDGYRIANVLASIDEKSFTGDKADLDGLKQILVERFLMATDDGWIFRGALSYRGAFQVEDEEAGAARVVMALMEDPAWQDPARFYLVRETVRLLPRTSDATTAAEVRQLAIDVANADSGFQSLRAKIHNAPEASDAAKVREYAAAKGKPAAAELYTELADAIDRLYAGRGAADTLLAVAEGLGDDPLAATLRKHAGQLTEARSDEERFARASRLLAYYRDQFDKPGTAARRRGLLESSLALEDDAYASGNVIAGKIGQYNRRDRLFMVARALEALYGVGFITERHVKEARGSLQRLHTRKLDVDTYRRELRFLGRGPEWSGRWIEFNFGPTVARFATLDDLAHLYPQFRLRGSPLLFYSSTVDGLVNDANELAGIEHQLFGKKGGASLRALNPGIARGTLRVPSGDLHEDEFDTDGIYLLPETISHLPPVAGILTQGEGSSLSHVQLLARNLGIPNVVVTEIGLPAVRENADAPVVMAVSPGGVVQLEKDGSRWDDVFGKRGSAESDVVIEPDLEKLDLSVTDFVSLDDLRASDSGRISGPKGANLGELKHHFGDRVPPGFVIPFGVFRELLDKPLEPGGPSVWSWMKSEYEAIAALHAQPDARKQRVRSFLTRLRTWIENVDVGPDFRRRMKAMLEKTFGPDGSYGVFVRSDTNVEDLPGFTGAGLNLTVANKVGSDAVLQALHAVWASPFTERAFSWRQDHMKQPEYVFPAVVIQLGFPSEKSGVMVTADVDTGASDWFSVAVNEGVGGAVDGQAAESLKISADGKQVRFLAQATAPKRPELSPRGGVKKVPASGTDAVLAPGEIQQLVAFAHKAPEQFPSLRGENGGPDKPADVEFAFKDGELALLQLRPFVESKSARRNSYLVGLDAELAKRGRKRVDLDDKPKGGR